MTNSKRPTSSVELRGVTREADANGCEGCEAKTESKVCDDVDMVELL